MIANILGGIAGALMGAGFLAILGYAFYRDDIGKSERPAVIVAIVNAVTVTGLIAACIVIAGLCVVARRVHTNNVCPIVLTHSTKKGQINAGGW